jgi:hypothetical protein
MSIVRIQCNAGFTTIQNEIIDDEGLDGSTLGLLVYLLSKPPYWKVTISALSATKRFGSHGKLTNDLKTLRTLGYAELKRYADGHTDWIITDSKGVFEPHSQKRNMGKATDREITPHSQNRNMENEPHSENPHVENRNVLVKTIKKKKEVVSKQPKISISESLVWENISDIQKGVWTTAYPAINIDIELAKAAAWINANPDNKKSNYARFLNGWFQRAQDKAPRVQNEKSQNDPRRSNSGLPSQQMKGGNNYERKPRISPDAWYDTNF